MLRIDSRTNKISLTRGDTAYLEINIIDDIAGAEYTMAEGDEIALTVKKTVEDAEALIQKVSKGTNTFHLLPEDTKSLAFGTYKYDIQLTKENGDVFTVIAPSAFEIMPEVTT